MNNIVIPIDFSDLSKKAVNFAVRLGEASGAKLHIVHFFPHPLSRTFSSIGDVTTSDADAENIETMRLLQRQKQYLDDMAQEIQSLGLNVHYEVIDNELIDGLENYINEHQPDLIVMSTTGEETFKEKFTGNHTEQVIENIDVPVLVIQREENIDALQRMLWVISAKKLQVMSRKMALVKKLTDLLKAELTILIFTEGRDVQQVEDDSNAFCQRLDLSDCEVVIEERDPGSKVISHHANRMGASMIIAFEDMNHGWFRPFSSNEIEKFIRESKKPVLAYNLNHD